MLINKNKYKVYYKELKQRLIQELWEALIDRTKANKIMWEDGEEGTLFKYLPFGQGSGGFYVIRKTFCGFTYKIDCILYVSDKKYNLKASNKIKLEMYKKIERSVLEQEYKYLFKESAELLDWLAEKEPVNV
jgi:hypothetical protein